MKRLDKRTILVVDDEPGYQEILSEEFSFEGAVVKTAGSGTQALEVYKKFRSIDVIVSDINMPNGNGIFLLKEVLTLSPQLPVILLITDDNRLLTEAKKLGAKAFFSKPCDMEAIILKIQNLLTTPQANAG